RRARVAAHPDPARARTLAVAFRLSAARSEAAFLHGRDPQQEHLPGLRPCRPALPRLLRAPRRVDLYRTDHPPVDSRPSMVKRFLASTRLTGAGSVSARDVGRDRP